MASSEILNVSAPDAGVVTLTLNRPEALNALNTQLLAELADQLTRIEQDESLATQMVLTGEPIDAFLEKRPPHYKGR